MQALRGKRDPGLGRRGGLRRREPPQAATGTQAGRDSRAAENPTLPFAVGSYLGHLDFLSKQNPGGAPTPHQVTTFNWLLEEAKFRRPAQRVRSLRPIADGEGITVTDLRERLAILAEDVEG